MKTNKPHNFLLLALTAVFSCCSGEDYSDITVSGTPSGETSTAPLTITVTDGGYASLSGGSSTRASEVDYQTVFTEGDQIGVFAVKNNAIVKEVSNLCLTATPSTDANAALTWKSDSDETPASINGATYYAYYPYKSDLEIADLDLKAATAAGFFADVITKWIPAKHQSTYADYTAQDLMIAQGTADVSNKSLSFSMSHQMALVVIDLPKITYTFTNTDPSIPEYIIDVPDKEFNNFTPYLMDNGMYRYLVHPSTDDALLAGSYTGEHGTTAWKVNTKSIPAGNYKIYKVDGGSTQYNHKLASGDFFMKDGSLLAGSIALTPEQQAACIGIVFKVGMDESDKLAYYDDKFTSVHGYVVALKDAVSDICEWGDREQATQAESVGSTSESVYNGYKNTKLTIDELYGSDNWNLYKVFHAIINYNNQVKVPANSTDWYLPSLKQLIDVYNVNGSILSSKLKTYGKQFITSSNEGRYWSSTQRSSPDAWHVRFANGGCDVWSKGQKWQKDCYARAILTF